MRSSTIFRLPCYAPNRRADPPATWRLVGPGFHEDNPSCRIAGRHTLINRVECQYRSSLIAGLPSRVPGQPGLTSHCAPVDDAGEGVLNVTSTGVDKVRIRRASARDAPAVLAIFDDVIAWFVAIGNDGQWGRGWSTQPRRIARDRRLRAARRVGRRRSGRPRPRRIDPRRVHALRAARDRAGNLRARAGGVARCAGAGCRPAPDGLRGRSARRAAGVARLRVDCYGGGTGALVRFYESSAMSEFHPSTWKGVAGAVLGRRL